MRENGLSIIWSFKMRFHNFWDVEYIYLVFLVECKNNVNWFPMLKLLQKWNPDLFIFSTYISSSLVKNESNFLAKKCQNVEAIAEMESLSFSYFQLTYYYHWYRMSQILLQRDVSELPPFLREFGTHLDYGIEIHWLFSQEISLLHKNRH